MKRIAVAVSSGLRGYVAPIRERPQIGVMLVVVTLVMSGNALVAPVLSLYGQTLAASSTLVGMIITVFGVARLFVNYPAGVLSQRWGRRPLLVIGPAVIVVGSVGAALAGSIEWLLVSRFVQGLGSGIYMTTSLAAIADLSRDGSRGRLLALYQSGIWLGAGLGPVAGGTLAHHFGLAAPFWAYGAVCAAAAIVVLAQLQETRVKDPPVAAPDGSATPPAPVSLWRLPLFPALCAMTFGTFFTRTATQWLTIPLIAHTRHQMGVDAIGAALAVSAVGTFLMLPIAGVLIDRRGSRQVIVASTGVTVGSLLVIALAPHVGLFSLGMLLLGIGLGLSGPAVSACSAEIVPRAAYGPAMGILRTWGDVGFVLGPILVGAMKDVGNIGASGAVAMNALILLMLLPGFLRAPKAIA